MARYSHSGAAVDRTLVGDFLSGAVSATIDSGTGWPTGAGGKFWVAVDPDTASEEHFLVNARSGTALTLVSTADRGLDGTAAQDHFSGAPVRHIFSAVEADAANAHVNDATHLHAYLDVAGTWTAAQKFTAQDTNMGPGGAGGAGGFVDIGSSGVATTYIVSGSSAADADLIIAGKGTGGVLFKAGSVSGATVFDVDPTAPTSGQTGIFVLYHNGTSVVFQRVTLGGSDSGGTGFKALRVPN